MSARVAVVGAGSWGTTLANLLSKKGEDVVLWAYEPEVSQAIEQRHVNPIYLPEVELSATLRATSTLQDAVEGASVLVSVSPAQHVRRILSGIAGDLPANTLVVSASKGIETTTLDTMAEVMDDILPASVAKRASFLSGPSFALEVAQEHPTAVAVASRSTEAAQETQTLFQTDYFRVYTNPDVRGVELGGALKNVIALAAGMADGLGFGHNTRAALITRGLAEMARLGTALGANPITFAGLAGMGDLILTCTGGLSRNRTVGVRLGKGERLSAILGDMKMVAEGVETSRAAHDLALREGIEMPIVSEVYSVLFEDKPAAEAVRALMLREPRPEQWQ